ncbi:MAG: HAMP domain-containing histidine kinase [Desulfuromonas sp.]|nr:HAMP domain-containing histidine kinase [Desulfuromonas sp.]
MEFKSPLSQRIIISFVLLTTVVSGLFGLGITLTIHFVEESLVSEELRRDLVQVLKSHPSESSLELDDTTLFFASNRPLPDYLQPVPPGFTEVVLDRQAYYVYRLVDGETSFYLVRNQTQFEQRETQLVMIVLAGFLLSILFSFLLGRFLVNKVIAPVRRLTHQVRDREKLLTGTPPLSPDYVNDEVGALAKAFDTTIVLLQQALRRETLFTSDVSHELRTPLMIINSSCDLLIEKNSLDDYARQRVGMISKAAREIQELVEAFLALARDRDTNLITASLAEVVQAGLPTWQQQSAEKGLTFTLQNPAEAAPGAFPAILLRTVLNNLIRNAIHHTAQGEISLCLTANGFELRDSGTGIAADEKLRVFQPFYRGEAPHQNSLGLGLSLVQRICEREHWTITLEDNLPHGCLFTVALG